MLRLMTKGPNSTGTSKPDRVWLGTRNTRSNSVHRQFPLSDSSLMSEIFSVPVYPASLKPEAETSLFPSFVPQIWHLSIHSPNLVLQPQEPLRSGHNIGSFLGPYFQRGGDAIVMALRQLFTYRCNPIYVSDRTSGSHHKRGPVSIASNSATISEPDHT
jgi:hypothetical protein